MVPPPAPLPRPKQNEWSPEAAASGGAWAAKRTKGGNALWRGLGRSPGLAFVYSTAAGRPATTVPCRGRDRGGCAGGSARRRGGGAGGPDALSLPWRRMSCGRTSWVGARDRGRVLAPLQAFPPPARVAVGQVGRDGGCGAAGNRCLGC